MKKALLCWAIAASISPIATASTTAVVSSNITNLQLWVDHAEILTSEGAGYFSDFKFGGTATDFNDDGIIDSTNLTLTGVVGFNANAMPIRLLFDLGSGAYTPGAGIIFGSGTIEVDAYDSGDWTLYSIVDATANPLPFLAGRPGHLYIPEPGQTTAGITSGSLPGLWDGQYLGVGYDRAVSVLPLFELPIGFFLEGTLSANVLDGSALHFSPSEVPVPAAVWLFGSALAGLAGVRRFGRSDA